jgi:glycosyltransferase involved in cell wall biosynthesis
MRYQEAVDREKQYSMDEKKGRIAIFISYSGQGGVERMVNNLAGGFLDEGHEVDMVIARTRGIHLNTIPEAARQIRLGSQHTFSSLPGLVRYLRREKPDALLAVKDRAMKVAVLARYLSGFRGRLVGRIGTTPSEALSSKGLIRRTFWFSGMRLFYPGIDHIVGISEGVVDDIRSITGMPLSKLSVAPNPVVSSDLLAATKLPVDHPWFTEKKIPVIMGIGRLTEQKDFSTLIRAFALVREQTPCRLVILGEGNQRKMLQQLITSLNLEDVVSLPGFVTNPYPWLSRSSLFVFSSRWEGLGNVLIESLALGVPVVSTDCRSGPREILHGGKYGELVAVGDWEKLAEAMIRTLRQPLPPEFLKEASAEYSVQSSSRRYLEIMIDDHPGRGP